MVKGANAVGTGLGWDVTAPGQRPIPRPRLDPGQPAGNKEHVRLHDRRLRDPRVRDRRAGGHTTRRRRGRSQHGGDVLEARDELAQSLQPGDGLPRAHARRRQLPARSGVPGFAAPGHRTGRVGGRQLDPVHVERPPGPARTLRRDGRQRQSRGRARPLLHAPQHQPQGALQLGRQRAHARDPLGVRLRRQAPVTNPRRRAPHRHRAVLPHTQRRARERRSGRHVVVVRVGCARHVPRDARIGQPRAGEPTVPARDDHAGDRSPPRDRRTGRVASEPLRAVLPRRRTAHAGHVRIS